MAKNIGELSYPAQHSPAGLGISLTKSTYTHACLRQIRSTSKTGGFQQDEWQQESGDISRNVTVSPLGLISACLRELKAQAPGLHALLQYLRTPNR